MVKVKVKVKKLKVKNVKVKNFKFKKFKVTFKVKVKVKVKVKEMCLKSVSDHFQHFLIFPLYRPKYLENFCPSRHLYPPK